MKKVLVASIAAAMLLTAPAVAAPPELFNWTGCYIGVNGGYGGGSIDPTLGSDSAQAKPQGFVGGGQAGCDYQASNWVFGLQGDFSGSRMHNSKTLDAGIFTETFDAKIDWLASATGRVGYAWGPALIYGKGGAAWIREKFHNESNLFGVFTIDETATGTHSGFTLGGGYEYRFAHNLSFFVEYDYYNFGKTSVTFSGTSCSPIAGCGPTSEVASIKQDLSVVKVGLNLRFETH